MKHFPCKDCGTRDEWAFHTDTCNRCKDCYEKWAMGEIDEVEDVES